MGFRDWAQGQYRDVPDAFGRDKNGRIPKGQGYSAADAKRVAKVSRDEDGKTYRKVKGKSTPTQKDDRQAAKQAKAHQKKLREEQKEAKRNRKGMA